MCYNECMLRLKGLSFWLRGKEPTSNAGDAGLIPGLERSLGEGNGNPLQFLPGKSHGQRRLVGYSLWAWKRVGWDLVTKQQQQQNTKAQGVLEVKSTTILDLAGSNQFMLYPMAMSFFFKGCALLPSYLNRTLGVYLDSVPTSDYQWFSIKPD